jgi:Ran-binding protein 9/10
LFYFEVYIANSGSKKIVGVGLSIKEKPLNKMPGWQYLSYAYHGDDGKLFCSNKRGKTYGPTYTTGDTVGCGINRVTREIFFTKNGKNLGKKILSL